MDFWEGGETPSLHPSAGQANYSELESVMNIVAVRDFIYFPAPTIDKSLRKFSKGQALSCN